MNILNGTKTGIISGGATTSDCDTVRSELNSLFVDTTSDLASFSLNPNANPTYTISGLSLEENSAKKANFGSNKLSKNSSITVIAKAGENETNIEPASIKVWIYDIGTLEADGDDTTITNAITNLVTEVANGTALDSDGKSAVAGWTLVASNAESTESSSANYSYAAKITNTLQIDNYYIMVATGADQDGAYFAQDTWYGFLGSSSSNPPEITLTVSDNSDSERTVADQSYFAKSDDIKVNVKVHQDDTELVLLTATVTAKNEVSGEAVSGTYTRDIDMTSAEKNSDGDYEFNYGFNLSEIGNYSGIKIESGDEKSYFYTLKFKATNKSGGTTENQVSLHVDAIKPVVSVTSVTPYVEGADRTDITNVSEDNTYLNGTIKVGGNVTESNLSDVSYEIYVDDSKVGDAVSLGQTYQFSPAIDTATLADGKTLKVRIIATDEVGNTGESDTTIYNGEVFNILQATDKPLISVSNADITGTDATDIVSENVFEDSTSNIVKATIKDDDGIAKVDVSLYDENGTLRGKTTVYSVDSSYRTSYSLKYSLPSENGSAVQGIYGLKIDVYDSTYTEAAKDNRSATTGIFYVGVDTGSPSLTETTVGSDGVTKNASDGTFTLSGTAGDVNGIKSLAIIDTSNSNKSYEVAISDFTKTSLTNAWSQSFVIGSANSSAENYIADGKHIFQITAEDTTGKTTSVTRTVTVDTTAPSFTSDPIASISGATSNVIDGKTWYKTDSLPLRGTASDGTDGTGIASVEYNVSTSTTEPAADDENWKQFAGTSSFSGTVEGIVSGTSYIWIKLTDNAGNTTSGRIGTWYIDTASPSVTEGSVRVGGTEVSESSPYYSNGTADAEITFSVKDPADGSGINTDKVYVLPYSSLSTDSEIAANKAAVSGGTASFTVSSDVITKSGTVYARIYDNAGNYTDTSLFAVTFDSTKPKSNNPVVEDTSSYNAYKSGTDTDGNPQYYVNNSKGTFTFSGIATDNLGISKVELSVTDGTKTVTAENTGTTSEYKFENVNLSTLSGSATATVTITDLAGNTAENSAANPTKIKLLFDVTAPTGVHNTDAEGKDLNFRIGENDNDDINSTDNASLWSESLDTDVGGKYKSGTYGNANTIKIRGTFNEEGSGTSMIYYKVAQTESDLTDFATKYASSNTGYFAPLGSAESRRVFYNVTHDAADSLGGTKFSEGTKYDRYYTSIDSTYDSTLSGFQQGENYLAIVVVDNVGNAKLDTVEKYTINVDTKVPEAEPDSTETVLTNGKYDDDSVAETAEILTFTGKATDAAAGLYSITFEVDGHTISEKSTDYGTMSTSQTTADSDAEWSWTLKLKKKLFNDTTKTNLSISAHVTDKAGSGNSQSYNVGNISIDKTAPTISLTSPTDAYKTTSSVTDINKTITLSGNAEDGNTLPADKDGVSQTITKIEYSTDGTTWTDSGLTVSGNYSFTSSDFDTTTLSDKATYYLRAVGVDKAGNTGYSNSVTVYVNQESDRPVINFTNLTTNADGEYILKLSDSGTIEGTITDDDSTATQIVKSFTVTELASADATSGTDKTVTVSSSGDFTFEPDDKSEGAKYYKFTVVDNKNTTFTSKEGTTATNWNWSIPVLTVKSTAIADSADDVNTAIATTAFTYKSDNESPVIDSVYALASDSSGNAEDSSSMISAAYYAGGKARQSVVLTINASDTNGIAGITAVLKNGNSTIASYKTTTESTIAGKSLPTTYTWVKNGTYSPSGTTAAWELPALDVSSYTGTISLIITPYDKSGLTGNSTQTFSLDNEGPSVTVTSHKDAASDSTKQYNGSQTLTVATSDTNETASIRYFVPTKTQVSSWSSYTDTQKEALSWDSAGEIADAATGNFAFTGTNLLDQYASSTYASSTGTDSDTGTTWYVIPVWFRAVDEFGNIAYSTSYSIKFNPDLDKPITKFTYPETDKTLGGTIRAMGTAEIPGGVENTSVSSVYLQIGASTSYTTSDKTKAGAGSGNYGYTVVSAYDVINEIAGTSWSSTNQPDDAQAVKYGFESAEALASWWGIKTTNNTWKLNLNENGEMNPTGEEMNTVYLRACSVNSNFKFGAWSDDVKVSINKSAPGMSGKLYQFTTAPSSTNITSVTTDGNVTGEKEYETGMYIKGQWYIECTATETTAGSKVTIDGVTKDGETLVKGTDYFQTADEDSSIKVYIPVDSSASSTTVYKVTAIDGTGLYSATDTYSINVDNTAPTIKPLYSDYDNTNAIAMTKIENSNYKYDIYSTTEEEGAGLAFMAIYFMRDGKVELPLPSITSTTSAETKVTKGTKYSGTLTQVTSDESGEVLYGVNGTLSAVTASGSTTTITSSVITSDNSFIRNGSLVKISGSYYALSNVNTTDHTATVATTFGTTPTTAFFAAAIASKTSGEGGSTSGGVTTISKDDGDGFVDPLDKSGSIYTWQLEFFSDELADGIVDIVVVAADKAGNYSTDTTKVMLTNHKPRVSKVFLATDLNGDGTFTEDEFGYTKASSETTYYAYSALSDDGKEQVSSVLAANNFAVKDGLAVTFEMVGASDSSSNAARSGGGNNLYYITKLLTASSDSPATGTTTAKLSDMSGTTSGKINVTTDAAKVSSTTGLVLTNSNITSATGWDSSMENETSLATQSVVQFTLWDDVNNTTTIGTNDTTDSDGNITAFGNQYTIVNIPVYFDMTDDVKPASEITPFYWNKEKSSGGAAYSSNNSLYFKVTEVESTDSYDEAVTDESTSTTKYYTYTPMGHIELDTNSVSGVIKLEGTVSDDQRLSSIAVTYGGTAVGTATYVPATHTWTGSGSIANGYEMSAEDTAFGQSGHTAKWTLLLDTAKYGNAASKAIVVTATQAKTATATANNSAVNETFTVAAVPYITGIVRANENISSGTMNRSKLGSYPVVEGESITVSGFNFTKSGTWTVGSHNTETAYTATQNDTTGEYSFTMTVPGRSGSLSVTDGTNSITSLNNSNDNTKNSNKETYQMSGNSTQYTSSDDRYLSVWNLGNYFNNTLKSNSDEFEYPVMTASSDGKLYGSWGTPSNGSVAFSYGLANNTTSIYNAYDQPGSYTGVAFDQKGTSGAASVMYMAELQGNGGTYSVTALASNEVVGGAVVTQIGKDDITNTKVYSGKKAVVSGNPSVYLDGDNTTGFYSLGNYDMQRRLGIYKNPQSARYGNYLHNIWYDAQNESLKYSVVNLDKKINDTALSTAYANNAASFAGWVLIDGTYTGQDRVYDWTTDTTGAKTNNKVGGADNKDGSQTGVNSTHSTTVFEKVVFMGSNTNKDQTKTSYIGTTTSTSLVMNGVNYANAPEPGDSIALLHNEYGAYKIVLSTITKVNGNTITWADELPSDFGEIRSATVYEGDMNVVGGTVTRNLNGFTPATNQSSSAGSSAAIDVTTDGYPVVAYYDATNSQLRVACANSSEPRLASEWTRLIPGVKCSGEVSMKVDGANNIHIMYNNEDGEMCYLFGTYSDVGNYTWSAEEVIDDTGSLAYGSISVVYNGTSYVPTMTWLNKANTANSVKYARRTQAVTADTASSKGSWDFMIIPALGTGHYALKECKISIESTNNWTDTTATVLQHQLSGANTYYSATATPALVDSVLAYKTSNAYETAYLKKE